MNSSTKSVRTLGLAGLIVAVALMVVASVGVASASAACLPSPEGKWADGNCTTSGTKYVKVEGAGTLVSGNIYCYKVASGETGSFKDAKCTEAQAGGAFIKAYGNPFFKGTFPDTMTSESPTGVKSVLETVGGRKVECEKAKNSGEITGERSVAKVSVTFTGKCHAVTPLGSAECHSIIPKTTAAGTIETVLLKGKPVYINSGTKEVGIDLEPESGTLDAEFKCEAFLINETIRVKGSVVCHISPINTSTTSYTLKCLQKTGVQEPTKYEEPAGTSLTDFLESQGEGSEAFGYEQSAEQTEETITLKTAGELVA